MSSSWYRRGTVTVTDGSKEVVGVGTLWVDAGNKPLAGDIMFIAGSIYEVESITDNEHLSLFRPFTGVPPANGEYAIIRNTSVTIATRVAAMVAAAINSKQVLLDDLRGYYTSTADKVLIHTDDGSTIEVVPLQTLVSDITNLIAQSESIKNDLANTQAALDLVRQYSNAEQGVEVEPGKYSAKSYAADAADTLALVNQAKSDVDLKASQVQQTKTDIEQFVSTSKTEIDAKATAISKAIDTQATTVKGEITDLTSTSKQEITALATKSKKDITTLTTTSKSEISELVAGGTNSITSLTDTSKGAINTLVSASKTEITDLATTEKAAISQQSTTAISEMTSLKQSAEQAASTATQKATQAAASATSAAQSKTDAQTLKTQTEALANETKQVAEEIKSGSYVGWQIYCQSEANMKAAQMLASEQFAASGFVHYGQGYSNNVNSHIVNEGLWSNETFSNVLRLGRGNVTTGSSKTTFPVTYIAGFISKIFGVNQVDESIINSIKFPEAPNGTVVYDSTGNCRGAGKPTLNLLGENDPKYENTTLDVNEAVARAFEGKVCNGNFRAGVAAYWRVAGGGTITQHARGALISANGNVYGGAASSPNIHIDANVTVRVSCTIHACTGSGNIILRGGSGNHAKTINANSVGYFEHIVTPKTTADGNYVLIEAAADTTFECVIGDISVKPLTEEVVINRVDMFGFEYFLEEISKANPFVYPYGCIQSKLTSIEGIATKESNRPITYYSVFDGDTTSKGKGVDFWAATDAQKRALVSNPDHNIYLLDDGRLVQWRVRQRTIAGAGNGKWFRTNPNIREANGIFRWADSNATVSGRRVRAQGSLDSSTAFCETGADGWYSPTDWVAYNDRPNKGVFSLTTQSNLGEGVNRECYFLVCGVVPRLNQGAYHPSFNPMGTAKTVIQGVGWLTWFDSKNTKLHSTSNCFKPWEGSGWGVGGGAIANGQGQGIDAGGWRPDGKYYDAIYASGQGGVIDYRLSAWDMSSKEEASKIFQKVVNGTYRGEEELVESCVFDCGTPRDKGTFTGYAQVRVPANTIDVAFANFQKATDVEIAGHFIDASSKIFPISNISVNSGGYDTIYFSTAWVSSSDSINITGKCYVVPIRKTNIPVSGDFTQLDLLGSPANIIASPEFANGWVGNWIPVIPNDTLIATDFQLVRKAVTTKMEFTWRDAGNSSWGSGSYNVNTTLNTRDNSAAQSRSRVAVNTYTAFAKQTKSSTNKKVLNGSEGIGDVWASADNFLVQGNGLIEALLGKVGKDNQDGNQERRFTISRHFFLPEGLLKKGSGLHFHTPVDLLKPLNDSPAVKALWYQTADSQQCSLNFAWNELVYKLFTNPIVDTGAQMLRKRGAIYLVNVSGSALNGRLVIWNGNEASIPVDYTAYYVDANNVIKSKSSNAVSTIQLYTGDGWGDDSTIRIIDGIGTFINLNGDTCLYGTHELAIPYGYTKNKARACSQVSGVDL
ncbi:TPA: hypothetical protein ACY4QE_000805 [Vibrio parahaemolyticus]|uniref:hypothetical protein n=1 Tax=Vibrio parahaemolyticus TaxID=670 RepID=UPI00186AAB4A|nr:hypothetical protein [Vibrio parahaemolyticus]MBE4171408.1 hypothetical protein [Vibrio parahaemolyticus]MCR9757487.1 hypothetical protein [Vibrio parahaemolyticus]